jgi:uncharacterized membrane protein YagU involved in acid resistance
MKNINFRRALLAGFAATIVMSLIMVMAPLMGMPKMDVPAMLGSMLSAAPATPGEPAWLIGLFIHLIIGTAFLSVIYAFISGHLPTSSATAKGAIFGVLVWLISQVMVMPMMGAGLFSSSTPSPTATLMGSLIGHLVYGGIVGSLYGASKTTAPVDKHSDCVLCIK